MVVYRIAGHLFLWVGFLAGALVTVLSTEVKHDPWATINWISYALSLAVAIVGVILLRLTARHEATQEGAIGGKVEELAVLLHRIRENVAAIAADWSPEKVYEVHPRIDEKIAEDLAEFADRRTAIVRSFGLRTFGRIMTDFARAERQLNRCWCASADGYADEVTRCLLQAQSHLDQAATQLNKALNGIDSPQVA